MFVSKVDLCGGFGPALVTFVNDVLAVMVHGAFVQAKKSVIRVCLLCFWTLSKLSVAVS